MYQVVKQQQQQQPMNRNESATGKRGAVALRCGRVIDAAVYKYTHTHPIVVVVVVIVASLSHVKRAR